ncbi:hypothetical protein FSP39_020763 [Pinctada imbricata]|uniref:Mesencephalic astrocyte-derived neurotrophic factor homolog n=1 Tax=Pinctada imbricata TaxID=66713 RepID=A0AA89C2K6_PINIB|nr:hypothetical protein FSP39_020763 [Pinctada imbricata]
MRLPTTEAVLAVFLSLIVVSTCAKIKEGECEVCVKVLGRFITDVVTDDLKKDPKAIEEAFMDFCKNLRGKEERFCYYIGGLKTSATYILGAMAKPISWSMPALKVCEKLKDKDPQICDLKYDKQIDLSKVDLKKLKVKDLKKILSDWNEDQACKGCAEKSDFIRVVEELMPKYAPEAHKARQQKTEL